MPLIFCSRAARLVLGCVAVLAAAGSRADSAAVWVHPHLSEPGSYASLTMTPVEAHPWGEPIDLPGVVTSSIVHPTTTVQLRLLDESGRLHTQGAIRLPLDVGANPFTFSILPEVLSAGQYEAHFRVMSDDFQLMAEAVVVVRKLDGRDLRRRIEAVEARAASLRAHLDDQAAGISFPYERMRIAAVDQLLPASRRLLDGHSLLRADETVRYMAETLDSVRATLTFGNPAALGAGAGTRPAMAAVEPRDGAFYAGQDPVFLFGFAGGGRLVHDLELFSKLGLNFAMLTHGPGGDASARLRDAVEQARRHNMALSVQVGTSPEVNFPRGADYLPGQYTILPAEGGLVPGPADPFLLETLEWLGQQDIVHSAGVINRPVMQFRGEDARLAFVDYLREQYPTRYDLNRSWKVRVRSFDEVELMAGTNRIAYQHDWTAFSRRQGAVYLANHLNRLRAAAPSLPLYMKHTGLAFDPSEPLSGIDYERTGPETPLTAVSSRMTRKHPRYALEFPQFVLPYVLLRSLIPGQPLLDAELHLDLDTAGARVPGSAEDFVHAGIWDAAIEGLNGAALWAWTREADAIEAAPGDLIEELGALEGLARANLDLNRLADVVVAFQKESADVAILFSHETLIRPESDQYRESLVAAYEGVSFGGRKVRFMTERQVAEGGLEGIEVLVLPRVRALPDETYAAVSEYIERGGVVIRTPNQIPYDGRGHSRPAVIVSTLQTVLVRGLDTPTAYFHAIEAAYSTGLLPQVPRPSNEFGYLLEGVKSRFVEHDGEAYLYLVNLRQEPIHMGLNGPYRGGYDLIQGRTVRFPTLVHPLDPKLIRLGPADTNRVVIADREPVS